VRTKLRIEAIETKAGLKFALIKGKWIPYAENQGDRDAWSMFLGTDFAFRS
jgi:hypothetical protein